MAEVHTYTYLGRTSEGYDRWVCKVTANADDGYVQGTGIVLTFSGMANVQGIEGLINYGSIWNHVGNVIATAHTEGGDPTSCIDGNVVTLMVLQSAGAAAELAEKITENFGYVVEFYITVYGV